MSVRKDSIQIDVQIKADQGVREFQKLTDDSRKFAKQLNELEKAGKKNSTEYKAMQQQLEKTNNALKDLGGKGATLGQLAGRAKTLNREIRSLAPGTKRFVDATQELKAVNGRMKEVRDTTRQTSNHLTTMKTNAGGLPGIFGKITASFNPLVLAAGVGVLVSKIIDLGRESLRYFDIQAKSDAQLRASLESTGGVAGRTFEQLAQAADELQNTTLFGDEETQKAQALLLTFTNIREEIFDRTTPAVLDMATAMGTDLKAASIQVGKALNDPVKGVAALAKSGIQFSEDQKKVIKSLVDTGDTAAAQTLILNELEAQFGGSAEAAAKAGLGGYTQLTNKVNDIKESFGALINNGLQRLAPFLNQAADFVGKLVDTMISGEKATGQYAEAINFLIFAFKASTTAMRVLWELIKIRWNQMVNLFNYGREAVAKVRDAFNELIEKAKSFEFIRKVFNNLSKAVRFFSDLINNVPATFAGMRAAAVQAIDIIRTKFDSLGMAVEIYVKKAELALNKFLSDQESNILKGEIKRLEMLKSIADTQGKTVGEAYTEARDKFIAEANANSTDLALPGGTGGAPTGGSGGGGGGGTGSGGGGRRTKATAVDQLATRQFGGVSYAMLLPSMTPEEIEKMYDERFKLEQELLKEKFFEGVLTQMEYDEQLFVLKQDELQRRLDLLKEAGKEESLAAKLLQNEITENQMKEEEKRLENTKRTEELKQKAQQMTYDAFAGLVGDTIGLLSADEKSRKKNAGVIKAFSIGKVIADGFAEVQSIWRTANANPSNILFPGSGAVIAGVKTAAAVVRTNLAISKISGANFYSGGYTGTQSLMKDNQGRDIVGGVHKNEWVAPEWMTQHPEYSSMINNLEQARTRGFAEGGFANSDTNFTTGINGTIQSVNNGGVGAMAKEIIKSNEMVVAAIRQKQFSVPATQVQESLEEITALQANAQF